MAINMRLPLRIHALDSIRESSVTCITASGYAAAEYAGKDTKNLQVQGEASRRDCGSRSLSST